MISSNSPQRHLDDAILNPNLYTRPFHFSPTDRAVSWAWSVPNPSPAALCIILHANNQTTPPPLFRKEIQAVILHLGQKISERCRSNRHLLCCCAKIRRHCFASVQVVPPLFSSVTISAIVDLPSHKILVVGGWEDRFSYQAWPTMAFSRKEISGRTIMVMHHPSRGTLLSQTFLGLLLHPAGRKQ